MYSEIADSPKKKQILLRNGQFVKIGKRNWPLQNCHFYPSKRYFGLLRFLGIFLPKMLTVLQTQGAPKSFGQNHRVLSVSHRTLNEPVYLFGFFSVRLQRPFRFHEKKGQLRSQNVDWVWCNSYRQTRLDLFSPNINQVSLFYSYSNNFNFFIGSSTECRCLYREICCLLSWQSMVSNRHVGS